MTPGCYWTSCPPHRAELACAPSSPTATSALARYRRTGKRDLAQEHLTTAMSLYREMGMTYWLEKAEAELKD